MRAEAGNMCGVEMSGKQREREREREREKEGRKVHPHPPAALAVRESLTCGFVITFRRSL
jgi:hypothetical protein